MNDEQTTQQEPTSYRIKLQTSLAGNVDTDDGPRPFSWAFGQIVTVPALTAEAFTRDGRALLVDEQGELLERPDAWPPAEPGIVSSADRGPVDPGGVTGNEVAARQARERTALAESEALRLAELERDAPTATDEERGDPTKPPPDDVRPSRRRRTSRPRGGQ